MAVLTTSLQPLAGSVSKLATYPSCQVLSSMTKLPISSPSNSPIGDAGHTKFNPRLSVRPGNDLK